MARKTVYIDTEYPEFNHANGSKTLAQAGIDGATRYPDAFRWWTSILGQPAATFQNFTVASAVLNQAHWEGNGAGFAPGTQSTSRNNVERIPGGVYDINVGITVLQGRFIGGGTSIGLNGNASTELRYDHARWMDPRSVRAVIVSANWGTNTYLESAYISDVRVNGRGPNWKDASYDQHGICLQIMGETAAIGRVYVESCNGHGVWVNGAGPGRVEHLTTFDNALAGLYATSEKSGGTNGNSLGFLEIQHISGDNNGWVVLTRNGPHMGIGYLKNEDGLSAQRGRPKKGQVSIEAHGWVNINVQNLTDAIHGASGPTIVVNSTANKSRLSVQHYVQASNNGSVDEGRSALVMDLRTKQAWRPTNQNAGEYAVMDFRWVGHGNASSFTCSEPGETIAHNFSTRPGLATTYAGYNYAAGTPVWDPTGGTTAPPPAPTCQWVMGTPGAWSTCANGQQTRSTPYVSSLAGCTPTDPKPADRIETQACGTTPPPNGSIIATLTNYTNNDPNRSVPVSWKGAKRIRFTNLRVVSAPNFQRLAYKDAADTNGLRVTGTGLWRTPDGQMCQQTPANFNAGTYPTAEIVFPTPQDFAFFLTNRSNGSAWLFSADRVEVLTA
jgi:hypothetical protein